VLETTPVKFAFGLRVVLVVGYQRVLFHGGDSGDGGTKKWVKVSDEVTPVFMIAGW
jgi:hypothetical protein